MNCDRVVGDNTNNGCKFTDEYFFSSAKFYENGIKDFEFLNRYGEL
jgi:hypothetical protein